GSALACASPFCGPARWTLFARRKSRSAAKNFGGRYKAGCEVWRRGRYRCPQRGNGRPGRLWRATRTAQAQRSGLMRDGTAPPSPSRSPSRHLDVLDEALRATARDARKLLRYVGALDAQAETLSRSILQTARALAQVRRHSNA